MRSVALPQPRRISPSEERVQPPHSLCQPDFPLLWDKGRAHHPPTVRNRDLVCRHGQSISHGQVRLQRSSEDLNSGEGGLEDVGKI
jgi:hypothetical protein